MTTSLSKALRQESATLGGSTNASGHGLHSLAAAPSERLPYVSVIVPCRNEENFIAQCLESIVKNDYPKESLEVLVVDGMSRDRTREIIRSYESRYPFIRLVDNRKRSIPAAMNTGIRTAKGDTIIKMDAHSTYQPNHVSACIRYQSDYAAENVGGILKMLPDAKCKTAEMVALCLSHRLGSGNAYIKTGIERPTWADAAAFGCYKRSLFEKVGWFNEQLLGSSDMDMNVRIRTSGGRILLVPDIVINYSADANIRAFWNHNFSDGVWTTYVLKFGSKGWSWRHWIPLAFVSSLLVSLALASLSPYMFYLFGLIAGTYVLANMVASVQISVRQRTLEYLPGLPVIFAVRHLAHGLGALFGLLLVVLPGEHWAGRRGFEE